MANNPDSETFHEIPASKYYYLGDSIGAIPKNFFKFWTPFAFFSGVIVTAVSLLTDWWQRLLTLLFFGQYWFIGWFITPSILGMAYLLWRRKQKHLKMLADERMRLRRYQDATIELHEGVKKRR